MNDQIIVSERGVWDWLGELVTKAQTAQRISGRLYEQANVLLLEAAGMHLGLLSISEPDNPPEQEWRAHDHGTLGHEHHVQERVK